jgi:hypothetical protein
VFTPATHQHTCQSSNREPSVTGERSRTYFASASTFSCRHSLGPYIHGPSFAEW